MTPTFKDCPYKDNLGKRQDDIDSSVIRLEKKIDTNHVRVIDKISKLEVAQAKNMGVMGLLITIISALLNKFIS